MSRARFVLGSLGVARHDLCKSPDDGLTCSAPRRVGPAAGLRALVEAQKNPATGTLGWLHVSVGQQVAHDAR